MGGALLGVEPARGELAAAGTADVQGDSLPFAGVHQQGIATPQQSALCLASFDLAARDAGALRTLMRSWSAAAERLSAGMPVGAGAVSGQVPEDDGETAGLSAARLTLTFGFGRRVFSLAGLADHAPAGLRPLPRIGSEQLDPQRSGGDLMVQACAEDAMVAFHAVRALYRVADSRVRLRWVQRGFLASSAAAGETRRNLMGFKDGTLNPAPGQPGFDSAVWVSASERPAWLRDGTYMVFRRIHMNLARWDNSVLADQEHTIGRSKLSGAPLGRESEFDAPDFAALTRAGRLAVPVGAHIRQAHPDLNGGIQILRRGYSYDDGAMEVGPVSDAHPRSHQRDFDAGLAFIAFMRDPHTQFVPLARRLAAHDALNEYIEHVAGAVFAIPPGASPGGYVGETLLG